MVADQGLQTYEARVSLRVGAVGFLTVSLHQERFMEHEENTLHFHLNIESCMRKFHEILERCIRKHAYLEQAAKEKIDTQQP